MKLKAIQRIDKMYNIINLELNVKKKNENTTSPILNALRDTEHSHGVGCNVKLNFNIKLIHWIK